MTDEPFNSTQAAFLSALADELKLKEVSNFLWDLTNRLAVAEDEDEDEDTVATESTVVTEKPEGRWVPVTERTPTKQSGDATWCSNGWDIVRQYGRYSLWDTEWVTHWWDGTGKPTDLPAGDDRYIWWDKNGKPIDPRASGRWVNLKECGTQRDKDVWVMSVYPNGCVAVTRYKNPGVFDDMKSQFWWDGPGMWRGLPEGVGGDQ